MKRPPFQGLTGGAPLLVAVAFASLTLVADAVFGYTPQADSLIYLARARAALHGGFLDPALNWNLAPGYSLFLAVPMALGLSRVWVLVALQAGLLGWSYACLVRALGDAGVLTPRGRRWAVAALLLNPGLIEATGVLLAEPFVASLLLITATQVLGGRGGEGRRAWLLAGASAWLVLTRFETVFFLPLFALLARPPLRRVLLPLLLAPALALGANAVRNQAVFGIPTPFSFGGGVVLYAGVNVTGDGSYHSVDCTPAAQRYLPSSVASVLEATCGRAIDVAPPAFPYLDRLYRRAALREWTQRPVDVLASWPSKFARLWLVPAPFDLYTGDRTYRRGILLADHLDPGRWPALGLAKHAVYFLVHWATLVLIAVGAARGYRGGQDESRRWFQFSLAVAATLTVLMVGAFYGLPRFLVPTLLLLLPWVGGSEAVLTPRRRTDAA